MKTSRCCESSEWHPHSRHAVNRVVGETHLEVANINGAYSWTVRYRDREWNGKGTVIGIETDAMEKADRLADAIHEFEVRVADLEAVEKFYD